MTNKEDRFNIQKHIELHAVTNGADQTGWIHTHGMHKLGCPDLEIRGVPLFLVSEAASLLNHVARYIVEQSRSGDHVVQLGHVMSASPSSIFRFVKLDPIQGDEEHFQHERWALSDEPMRNMCDDCVEAACSCGSDCDNCDGCDEPGCDEPDCGSELS